MTLPAFRRAVGSQGASTTPQAAITVPTTGTNAVEPTDTCVLVVLAGGGSNASAAPDGTWTTIKADTTVNSGGMRYAIYRKVIGSDTTITPSWPTAPGTGNNTAHLALFFTGANGSEALGAHAVPGVASTATACPTTTTLGTDRLVLAIALNKGGSGGFPSTVSWSGGFGGIASQLASGNFFPSIAVASLNKTTAGATTEQTATWNYSTLNQAGLQVAVVPSVTALALSLSVSPNAGSAPLDVTATCTATGGNANPKTYAMDWDDGSTSGSQSGNTFTHTYAAAGEYDPVATVTQA